MAQRARGYSPQALDLKFGPARQGGIAPELQDERSE